MFMWWLEVSQGCLTQKQIVSEDLNGALLSIVYCKKERFVQIPLYYSALATICTKLNSV